MAVPRVYVRRGTTVWIGTTHNISLTQDALTLIFLYLYTIGPKGAINSLDSGGGRDAMVLTTGNGRIARHSEPGQPAIRCQGHRRWTRMR